MNKYIAYCRKSRDEADKQVLSIEAQIAELKDFARKENIEICEFITEAKTAKVPGREQFAELIKKVEKGKVNGIIAWHPDRLARNSIDGGRIIYLLDIGKLQSLKFPTHWFENTPQGKFMLSIAFGQSKYYVDNLSENVKRGQRQKLRNGVWPSKATYGYVNNPKTRGIDIDREKAKAIKKIYELFSTGNYSFSDIANFLHLFGFKQKSGIALHVNQIRKILSDKFYIGLMFYHGEYYEGGHKQFIPKDLFQKVQEELKRREKHHQKSFKFPFLGLAKCKECGGAVTAEKHTKFYKGTDRKVTYVYYRCTKKHGPCSQKMITGGEMENQIRNIVSDVSLPESWAKQWLEWAERDEILERQKVDTNIYNLKSEIQSIDKKQNLLLDSFLEGIIEPEIYKQKKNELFEKKLNIQENITKISENGSSPLEPFKEFIETALSCGKIARAKNNSEELVNLAKRVGSNFFLENRQLAVVYKNGFGKLRSEGGDRSFRNYPANSSLSVGTS